MTLLLAALACTPEKQADGNVADSGGTDSADPADSAEPTESPLVNAAQGNPEIVSIYKLAFGPNGYLAIADADSARIVVVNTLDATPSEGNVAPDLTDINAAVGDALGADADDVDIWDIAVNPASLRAWLAVEQSASGSFALLSVDGDGSLHAFDFTDVEYAVIPYEGSSSGSYVFDLAWTEEYLVAGTSNWRWTDNRVVVAPVPVVHDDAASVTGTSTYHRSHSQWETSAPVVNLFPYSAGGVDYVGANYACAPVVRFAVADLAAGDEETVGVTPFDYGTRKMVVDFETYARDGTDYVLASIYGLADQTAGDPESNGGARVELSLFVQNDTVNEEAPVLFGNAAQEEAQHEQAARISELDGVIRMSRVDDDRLLVLDASSLRVIPMP